MDLAFPAGAFLAALLATRRSLGLGFVAVLTAGYFNGVTRANFMGVYTTFMFDAGLLGLYLGFATTANAGRVWAGAAGGWALALIGWPALLTLVPVNDVLVQLVALRATVWFLPVMLLARRLTSADAAVVCRGLAGLNLAALAAGLYVYRNGVEALYPENAVTQLIYNSNDVAGYQYHRVPSLFLSSSSYGGAMLLSLPLLLGQALGARVAGRDRALAAAGAAAGLGGILLCAARSPAVMLAGATLVAWVVTRFDPRVAVVSAGVLAAGAGVAATNERLQRAATLEDAEYVSGRVGGSANESFFELVADYPAGAGMGSAVGTSIPFFLADRAPTPVGLENEFSRILVDQGLVGLGLWVAFLTWLLCRPPPLALGRRWGLALVLMYALVLCSWSTAFLGTGTLSAVPGSVLMLTQMGLLIRVRDRADAAAGTGVNR